MGKSVFLFPGQGSQEVGMGRDLFLSDRYFCKLVDEASELTHADLKTLCLKGPEKKLTQARYVQPLIVAISLGLLRHVQGKGIKPDFVVGHSLGEVTALAASGVIDDRSAVAISIKRGQLMDEAAAACNGGMMAVLSIELEKIKAIIHELDLHEAIYIANDNAPQQVVISGEQTAFDLFSARVAREGGRCKKINVAGPWHSSFIKGAYEVFRSWIQSVPFNEPRVSLICNGKALPESNPETIKDLLSLQLCSPVYFRQCLEYLRGQDVKSFFEIGPGRVLSGLVRANGFMRGVDVRAISTVQGAVSAMEGCPAQAR